MHYFNHSAPGILNRQPVVGNSPAQTAEPCYNVVAYGSLIDSFDYGERVAELSISDSKMNMVWRDCNGHIRMPGIGHSVHAFFQPHTGGTAFQQKCRIVGQEAPRIL